MPSNVLLGPGILGLRVRSLMTLRTRKSDIERQVLRETELLIYHFHEGEGQALNLKDSSCRGLGLQNKNVLEATHIFHECLVCKFISLFRFLKIDIFVFPGHHSYSPVSLFSLPLAPSFSPTPFSGSIQVIREKYDIISNIVLMLFSDFIMILLKQINGDLEMSEPLKLKMPLHNLRMPRECVANTLTPEGPPGQHLTPQAQ